MGKNKQSDKKQETYVQSRLGTVGGQALIEGVMMKSKNYTAVAVRRMDNKRINVSREKTTSIGEKHKFLRLPLIRGVVNFVETMKLSFKTLTKATDMLGLDAEEEEESKFDRWMEKHLGKWVLPVITGISTVLGIALAVGLFIWLPTFLCDLIFGSAESGFGSGALRSVVEGVFKIVIFITYIWLTAFIPDMKRVYRYHGAEHKSIFCYEKGLPLTVENVKKQIRFHPRCGTSFLFFMLLLSIFIGIACLWWVDNVWLRTLLKILLLPLSVSIGYEFIRYSGRHNNLLTKIISQPGLWMQRLTTKEPTDDIIEVGIASLKCALPDAFPGFYEEMIENEKRISEQEEKEAEEKKAKASENIENVPEEEKSENPETPETEKTAVPEDTGKSSEEPEKQTEPEGEKTA